MKKIIIATHHSLAKGFKSTLEYIVPNTVEVIDINGYIENTSIENQIDEALKNFDQDDQIIVFTDLLGGSVNQEFAKRIGDNKIELIAGANLPLIMTIVLGMNEDKLSSEAIQQAVEEARSQIVYVNDTLKEQEIDEDDE